jgi:hypothetical protein
VGSQYPGFARFVLLFAQHAQLVQAKMFAHFISQELRALLRARESGGTDIPG